MTATATAPAPASNGVITVTKTEAVKNALSALGDGAMPKVIAEWVAANYNGLEIKTAHISSIKHGLAGKKEGGDAPSKPRGRPGRKPGPQRALRTAPAATASTAPADFFKLLGEARNLADRLGGAKRLREVAELLG